MTLSSRDPLGTTLFWLMFLGGGAALAACLLLPPWFEYQAVRRQEAEMIAQVAAMERRLAALDRQIDHLRHDDAFVNRVARREFGLPTPRREVLDVEPPAGTATQMAPVFEDDAPPRPREDPLAELNGLVEESVQRYPLLWLLTGGKSRIVIMVTGALLVLTALLLLCRRPQREAR